MNAGTYEAVFAKTSVMRRESEREKRRTETLSFESQLIVRADHLHQRIHQALADDHRVVVVSGHMEAMLLLVNSRESVRRESMDS